MMCLRKYDLEEEYCALLFDQGLLVMTPFRGDLLFHALVQVQFVWAHHRQLESLPIVMTIIVKS